MNKPLADRFRPQSLDDIVGQRHLLAEGKPLRRIIESGEIPNLIFYGPSGVGKTTLATYIANKTNKTLRKLNGTTASTADIKEIVSQLGTFSGLNGILLYLDEIQYFNKKQQQTLLEFIGRAGGLPCSQAAGGRAAAANRAVRGVCAQNRLRLRRRCEESDERGRAVRDRR